MANDGDTRPSTASDRGRERDRAPAALLDEMRHELERAATDLERVTEQLHHRTGLVDGFEALVDELLDLLTVPVVLVDETGRVSALSRGAAAVVEVDDPAAVIGKQASSVLPSPWAKQVTAHVKGTDVEGKNVRFVALPGGSTLVVLGT
jgi:transcriptional regulator with PAS, ATPase and Fis domain